MTGAIILIMLLLVAGVGGIYVMYLRAEREKMNSRLKVFLSPGFTPWRVDKQVVEKEKTDPRGMGIVLYEGPANGRPVYPDLWP